MTDEEKQHLIDILNGMFEKKIFEEGAEYKINYICKLFDIENKESKIYNYY